MVFARHQRDHDDQRLSECRHKHRACHSLWLEARDDSAEDSDQDHPEIDQVEGVALNPDHPNCTHQPDEDEC